MRRIKLTAAAVLLLVVLWWLWGDSGGLPHEAVGLEDRVILNDRWAKVLVGAVLKEDGRALHKAALMDKVAVVRDLVIKRKMKPNEVNDDGCTALHWAAAGGAANAIRELARLGADVHRKDRSGATPLHYAAVNNKPTSIAVLLYYTASLKDTDSYGNTPLHWASGSGSPLAAGYILSHGGNIAATDEVGNTPLHEAAKNGGFHGNADIVPLLLSYNADPTAKNADGLTPYEMAVRYDARLTMSQLKQKTEAVQK